VIPKRLASAVVPASLLAFSGTARAQVHYDVGASIGIGQHLETDVLDNAGPPSPGFVGKLQTHLAVAPMIRVGFYALYDNSPRSGQPTRNIFGGGVDIRILPPMFRTRCTFWWLGFGLGYDSLSSGGFNTTITNSSTNANENVVFPSVTGGELVLPLTFGVARRIAKPFVLFAEVGARLGLESFGGYYAGRPGTDTTSTTDLVLPAPGNDTFAFSLTVGIMIDR
jgi:hypothetical protein